ncbi:hypothetical protein [Streptomyces decoyicus]|uniref:hypothetical protein n=1 Tax=Streptomyces decoyicus TaxID=249567 RepID=UPI003659014E
MTHLAFAGASIDGGPYTRITWPAQHTPHGANTLITYGTDYGLALFAALMLCDRQLGGIPVPAALLMAASRVRPGAHFPHDAAAGPIPATRLRPLVAAR